MDVITETMGIGNLIPAAICDLHLTGTRKGLLTSMVFFGKVFLKTLQLSNDPISDSFGSYSSKDFKNRISRFI